MRLGMDRQELLLHNPLPQDLLLWAGSLCLHKQITGGYF